MADVIVFHHAQGLTEGVRTFGEGLRELGHSVTVPDLFEGATFDSVEEGVLHAGKIGFSTIIERGTAVAEGLPASLVYIGFSLGALPAQSLAQTRPGARGAVLIHGGIPPTNFGSGEWPDAVPLQVHVTPGDEYCDLDTEARPLVDAAAPTGELFVYPDTAHLFADSSLPSWDPPSSRQVLSRTLTFLRQLDA
jgi:dienelactone hydrolase